jgi:hypothetical protein
MAGAAVRLSDHRQVTIPLEIAGIRALRRTRGAFITTTEQGNEIK